MSRTSSLTTLGLVSDSSISSLSIITAPGEMWGTKVAGVGVVVSMVVVRPALVQAPRPPCSTLILG